MHRFKRGEDDRGAAAAEEGAGARDDLASDRTDRPVTDLGATGERTAVAERPATATDDDRTVVDERPAGTGTETQIGRTATPGTTVTAGGAATHDALQTARARQRDEFGGINWGASFFGWLVAVGVAALLTAILAAAGAALDLTTTTTPSDLGTAEELSVVGAVALLVVLLIAYFAGGYVAGRMSRFDGARQGLGTWALGLVVMVLLAGAALIFGDEYNVLEQVNMPSLPVGEEEFTTGGVIALIAIVLGTIVAAVAGGKVGERYHKKVDRAGFVD
jgi:hypothetical protein